MSLRKKKIVLISLLAILLFILYFVFINIRRPSVKRNTVNGVSVYNSPQEDMGDKIKEDPMQPGTTCDYFSYSDYELPGETVKSLYQRADDLGYVSLTSFDKVETKTLKEYNKDAHPAFVIKEGDFANFDYKTQSVKDGIVFSNYYDRIVIEKKVDDIILQMKVKDVYTGPTFSLDRKSVKDFNNSNKIFDIAINSEDPTLGNPESPLIITVFLDFDLPDKLYGDYKRERYLKNINKLREEYISNDQIYLVIKHNLSSEGDNTFAGQAAQCAHEQGKFWEMHDIIFASRENQASLNMDSFLKWAEDLKIDIDQYKLCLISNKTEYLIKDGFKDARGNNLYGGPFFLINGKLLGSENYVVMQYLINQKLGIKEDYVKTQFSLGVLNACFSNRSSINGLLKGLFIDLGLDTAIIDKIPLEKNYIIEPF